MQRKIKHATDSRVDDTITVADVCDVCKRRVGSQCKRCGDCYVPHALENRSISVMRSENEKQRHQWAISFIAHEVSRPDRKYISGRSENTSV